MHELHITDTNSANDSKGRAFGLEGNDFLYVLIAFVVALGLYLVLTAVLRVGLGTAFIFTGPIVGVPLAWVVLLRHNKPAGYAEDWFDQRAGGAGFSFVPRAQPVKSAKEARHAQ
jgi:hypothetical protein